MESSRFDSLVKALATTPLSRATALRGLAASAAVLTEVALVGPEGAAGKKLGRTARKRICDCANELAQSCNQRKLIKPKAKKVLKRNPCAYGGNCQGVSGCASTEPPPPSGPTCTDGVKNGNETDIDCGGTCPRCATGKTCTARNDCASGLCAGTCQQCVNAGDCGTDTNGEMCACRDHESGQRFCTKLNAPPGRVFPAGTACTVCQGGEQCFPINGGAGGIECIRPCGS